MAMFSYPVRYISTLPRDFTLEELQHFTQFNIIAGAIKGETGIDGLRLDFNAGLRLQIPPGRWHVCVRDADSDLIFFDEDIAEMILCSAEKFFIRFCIEVYRDEKLVFSHIFDAREQHVFFYLADRLGMGDILALLPAIEAFREKHGCQVQCYAPAAFQDIIRCTYGFEPCSAPSEDTYATYYMGAWRNSPFESPIDRRLIPLADSGCAMLGLTIRPEPLRLFPQQPRQLAEKYVCIGRQASAPLKYWLYPEGWDTVVRYLRQLGYRVLVIDQERTFTINGQTIELPAGAEDYTGSRPLLERAELLAYADFFIGLGSGLSWLAHATGIPVILISGFSLPSSEFYTPYRIYNPLVCHGCYNDIGAAENHCRYEGSERAYECSRAISPRQVIQAIDQLRQDKENTV